MAHCRGWHSTVIKCETGFKQLPVVALLIAELLHLVAVPVAIQVAISCSRGCTVALAGFGRSATLCA
jgi:hypothetical protein